MNASEIAMELLSKCPSLKNYEAYMFGSYLNGIGVDIDVLIVGISHDRFAAVKSELALCSRELPLDVIFMEPDEANETNFVIDAGCVPFEKLTTNMT